jgi:tetratricopeptide (TPR) repeat protein
MRHLLHLALLLAATVSARAAETAPPAGFGADARALEAWLALEQDRPIRARELAERLLADEPGSFAAHCLIARVLRTAENSPALALRHAQSCRERFEARHGADFGQGWAGPHPRSEPKASEGFGTNAPWFWHRFALLELYAASEELERHADSLRWLDALEGYHPGLVDAFRSWPLLRLGRIDAARAAARRALERRANSVQVAKAWTALCALEEQAGDARAAYEACREALAAGRNSDDRVVRLVNAAEAARALGRFDEVESLLREATDAPSQDTLAAPWLELALLYTDQARLPEARAALREMLAWHRRQPPRVRAHTGARHERATALFLLAAGRADRAARIAARALEQPDRGGEQSASRARLEAASALVARAACRSALEQRLEHASWAPLHARPAAWLDAARFAWCAWRAERRAAAWLAAGEDYAPGALQVPEWLEPDVVSIAGAGALESWIERAHARGRLDRNSGFARLYAAEVAARQGRATDALAHARAALDALPRAEVLARGRAALRAADAAQQLGDATAASEHLALALQLDGGALRRAGLALPVAFESDPSPIARAAESLLRASPRLRSGSTSLRLALRELTACLVDSSGAKLACAEIEPRPDEPPLARARRLAAAFHARAFAPRMDWTQPDLDSLEGATAGLD